jgi:hypothetical protein
MRRNPVIILAFSAAATVAACETDLTPTIAHIGAVNSVVGVPHESLLVVAPSVVQLAVGGQAQLRTNAPDTLLRQLVWSSQIPTIASVSQTGLVTAGTPGTTIITVRYSFDTTNAAFATIQVR